MSCVIGTPLSRNPSGMMFFETLDDEEAIDVFEKEIESGEGLGF